MIHQPNSRGNLVRSHCEKPILAIALLAGLFGAPQAIAEPLEPQLLAQQIVDGLPPPPPAIQLPEVQPNVSVPTLPSAGNLEEEVYVVYVNGDSPLLLDQVRRVASDASIQDYQGQRVIQAGVFEQPESAEQQVSALEAQGIGAEIAELETPTPEPPATVAVRVAPPPELFPDAVTPREIEFGRSPSLEATAPLNYGTETSHFYVVIPGDAEEISDIAAQVIRLGGGIAIASAVQERSEPVGPHVLVGPFVDREAAGRWSDFFQDYGMDARLYYKR